MTSQENNGSSALNGNKIQDHQRRSYAELIQGNLDWVKAEKDADPDFFTNLAKSQNPDVLWIGCADSRVPANQVTNTKAGQVFVHRNIANMCVHSDMNMLSVLDYAVNVLKVKHIIVAGHYGCGGVAAALSNKQYGLIDNWLRHIKDVYRLHSDELDEITDGERKFDRMVELNVVEQVYNLCKTTIVQNAWRKRADLEVHGWVIELKTGLIKDLEVTASSSENLGAVFHLEGGENK